MKPREREALKWKKQRDNDRGEEGIAQEHGTRTTSAASSEAGEECRDTEEGPAQRPQGLRTVQGEPEGGAPVGGCREGLAGPRGEMLKVNQTCSKGHPAATRGAEGQPSPPAAPGTPLCRGLPPCPAAQEGGGENQGITGATEGHLGGREGPEAGTD